MGFEVIKNAGPLPEKVSKYPFDKMEVGDCFDVPRCGEAYSTGECKTHRRMISVAARRNANHPNGGKFLAKSHDKNTVRVWRIA